MQQGPINLVTTRSNHTENYNESAILARIIELSGNYHGLGQLDVTANKVMDKVRPMLHENIHTFEIDSLVARAAADLTLVHPDYMKLAGRITASNIHKQTPGTFSKCMAKLHQELVREYHARNPNTVEQPKYVNKSFFQLIAINAVALDKIINPGRDYIYSFTGFNQLKNTYFKKVNGEIIDRPQYVFLRIALALWAPRTKQGSQEFMCKKLPSSTINLITEYYDLMSTHKYIHATPTILNSGFNGQMDSCFLLNVDDNIENIVKVGGDLAVISKMAGGVGVSYSNIRGKGSYIAGTNGRSTGIMPQLKILESHAKAWNQGGARKGAVAIYLSDHHKDIIEFIEMRNKSGGDSDSKCHNLFNALWCHERFFKKLQEYFSLRVRGNHVEADKVSMLTFDSTDYPGIDTKYGAELEEIYERLEQDGRGTKLSIASYVASIRDAFAQSGGPFICNADSANYCSNMKNYGAICSSNLCTEIFLPTTSDSYACCTLANIALNNFVKTDQFGQKYFDYADLAYVTRRAIRALDRVVDVNSYPVPECAKNAFDLRPLGLGIQGLADVFTALGLPYLSHEAEIVDKKIFETMYYYSLLESADLASESISDTPYGAYPYFEGSDLHAGIFHWERFEEYTGRKYEHAATDLDWESLREIVKGGVRNATLLALMPTESTSKVLNNSPCIEPWYQHWYCNESDVNGRNELVNIAALYKAIELGLWTADNIKTLEQTGTFPFEGHWRDVFASAYEMPMPKYLERVQGRQYMVDQGISANIRHKKIDDETVIKQILLGRKLGLKTINYYVTIKPVASMVKITGSRIEGTTSNATREDDTIISGPICSRGNPNCDSCN